MYLYELVQYGYVFRDIMDKTPCERKFPKIHGKIADVIVPQLATSMT